jgi:hypothetical protein
MANERPTDFPTLAPTAVVAGDWLVGVDVSDLTDDPALGSDVKIAPQLLLARTTAQYTNSTTTSSNIAGLSKDIKSGRTYRIDAAGIFQTAATGTGLGLNFTGPAVTFMGWRARIQLAAAGSDQYYEGTVTTAAAAMATTKVVSTAVVAANTNYLWEVSGLVVPSADGTLQLQGSSEAASSQIIIQLGAVMILTDLG